MRCGGSESPSMGCGCTCDEDTFHISSLCLRSNALKTESVRPIQIVLHLFPLLGGDDGPPPAVPGCDAQM